MLVPKKRFPIKQILLYGFLPSPLKKVVYRLKGYEIGKNVSFGLGSVVIGDQVKIGDNSSIGFLSVVKAKRIKIGRFVKIGATALIDTVNFEIGDDSRINEQVFVGGIKTPQSSLVIGQRAIIMQMSFINPTLPITIGDDTGIGGHCLLFTHGSWSSMLDGYPVSFAPINIGAKVWLPWRVFVLPGVSIGEGSVIGADSTVNKNIPPASLAAGSPAKVLKTPFPNALSESEKLKHMIDIFDQFFDYIEGNGIDVKRTHDGSSQVFKIKIGRKKFSIFYSEEPINDSMTDAAAVFVGWNKINANECACQFDLKSSERIGSNAAGEELAGFLSRYGIRFKRLD